MPVKLSNQTVGLGEQPALLVIDASCGFTDPASPLGADFAAEVDVINQLIDTARANAWPTYFSSVWYEDDAEATVFRHKIPALNVLEPGSQWAEIDPRLSREPADHVFRKTHASCFFGTDLDTRLRSAGIDSLVMCGFTTSGCVRASAVDGLQSNYPTVVIADGVGDRDPNAHKANLYDLEAKYVDVMTLQELVTSASG